MSGGYKVNNLIESFNTPDKSPESQISMKYGIRNIPTLLFFKNGELVDRTVGVVSKQEITARIEKLI